MKKLQVYIYFISGQHTLPPLVLKGTISSLYLREKLIIALTTEASLSIWDFEKKASIMQQCVRHIGNYFYVL